MRISNETIWALQKRLNQYICEHKNKPMHNEICALAYCFFIGKNITYNYDLSLIYSYYFSFALINWVNVEA